MGRTLTLLKEGRRFVEKVKNNAKERLNDDVKETPMMRQKLKYEYPEYLLLFRMGDFYECFHNDAVRASSLLGLTLTQRGRGGKNDRNVYKMCGLPFFAVDRHLGNLVREGVRVAVCEQFTSASNANGIMERKVVRLVTSGTVTEDMFLEPNEHNYLIALATASGLQGSFQPQDDSTVFSIAQVDLSTGELRVCPMGDDIKQLPTRLSRFSASELVVPKSLAGVLDIFACDDDDFLDSETDYTCPLIKCPVLGPRCVVTVRDDEDFSQLDRELLSKSANWDLVESSLSESEANALSGLLAYAKYTQCDVSPHIGSIERVDFEKALMSESERKSQGPAQRQYMSIDPPALKSLELVRSSTSGQRRELHVIDKTITNAGGRLLSDRILAPLLDTGEINARLNAVEFFYRTPMARRITRMTIGSCGDLHRSLQRIYVKRGTSHDLLSITQTLQVARDLANDLRRVVDLEQRFGDNSSVRAILKGNSELMDNVQSIIGWPEEMISAHKELTKGFIPASPDEAATGSIVKGYSKQLDELRNSHRSNKTLINELRDKYREQTGCGALRISKTRISGYYVEVPKRFASDVAKFEEFIQTTQLKNSIRFKTAQLITLENGISLGNQQAMELENDLVSEFFQLVLDNAQWITTTAEALARIDVACGLATAAEELSLSRPEFATDEEKSMLHVEEGRHLVVENLRRMARGAAKPFISNSLNLTDETPCWLITGPNMGGKSTFLRQNAHIAVLAQMGSFVPATSAKLAVTDRLFCRVGASDELAADRSTFMVEMEETATILKQATARSLVIVDEVGRGTSTLDGEAISQAVFEHLLGIGCRTLFATHFHHIASSVDSPRFQSYSTQVAEVSEQGRIAFLYKIIPGSVFKSHGVNVAELAGVPRQVIDRATQLLSQE
eukprot:CAMPEP_0203783672 /NCGR_PEP_ID=MMETSP0100_2-20121128/46_1 /ASSEMBLY_ACC=CAM_ASM_000210 /TAXON_ID=96639 /ORGANISM=" , Strain NY0313808BC1" /LENGTH=904 /DNA_ID=CAMNT_0050685579 /DNA_START=126 /DNA_END=2840 /DNA_ORIENTATION=+